MGLPPDLHTEIFERLVQEVHVQSPIFLTFLEPIFTLMANSLQFLYFLFIQRISIKVIILSLVQFSHGLNLVIPQNIAHVINMVNRAYLLYLIDLVPQLEPDHIRPNTKVIPVIYFHSFFRNIHPSAILTPEILYVETFEPVIL